MKKLLLIFGIILSSGFFSLGQAQTLTLSLGGVEKGSQPYNIGVRLAETLAERMGITIKVVILPHKRATLNFKNGKIDGELSRIIEYKESVPNSIRVKEPITSMPYFVYTQKADFKVDGWQSLLPYRVAFLRGEKLTEVKLLPIHQNVHGVNTLPQALRLVQSGRVDLFVSSPLSVGRYLKDAEFMSAGIHPLKPPVEVLHTYTYLLPKHVEIAKKFEAALKETKRDGTYMKILTQTK